jgi:hypothetical protein
MHLEIIGRSRHGKSTLLEHQILNAPGGFVFLDPFKSAKPMPELFTQGWQRAGHPDLFLNSPTAKKAAA